MTGVPLLLFVMDCRGGFQQRSGQLHGTRRYEWSRISAIEYAGEVICNLVH